MIGKCIMSIFKKGVDPDWGRYTPLHLKSNPVPNPLLLKEWSVANPLHSLHWSGLWSGVSRSEPVSGFERQSKPECVPSALCKVQHRVILNLAFFARDCSSIPSHLTYDESSRK